MKTSQGEERGEREREEEIDEANDAILVKKIK